MRLLNLQRLTEPKLRSLFSELKIHDKEELAWKHLKAQGLDKEGLKEADLRHKLIGKTNIYNIMFNIIIKLKTAFREPISEQSNSSLIKATYEMHVNSLQIIL